MAIYNDTSFSVYGGDGDDAIEFTISNMLSAPISIDGGTGNDTLTVRTATFIPLSVVSGIETLIVPNGSRIAGTPDQFAQLTKIGIEYATTGSLALQLTAPGTLDVTGKVVPGIDLIIEGTSSNDTITGHAGIDYIEGYAGDDTLNGGDGNDEIYGGEGNDTVNGGKGDDWIVDTAGLLTAIDAGDGNDTVVLSSGFFGTADGGAGNDTLIADIIAIDENEGAFDLSNLDTLKGFETLVTNGAEVTVTSQQLSSFSKIIASESDPAALIVLKVKQQDGVGDFVDLSAQLGSVGAEIHTGNYSDFVAGGEGNDRIFTGGGNDSLIGNGGDDYLDGGGGADVMEGGLGNDIYIVDSAGDTVYDIGGGDEVRTSLATYVLAPDIEGLLYTGSGEFTGTGNELDNYIYGGEGKNTLSGGGGNDWLAGKNGDNILKGDAGNDSLYGGSGNDSLSGGTGNDYMAGGLGDDTYIVDSAGDVIVDEDGWDTVRVYMKSYTLADGLENLFYIGPSSFVGTGNAAANFLKGGDGNDTLYGLDGKDLLLGGAGDDTLYGGDGYDTLEGGAGNDNLYGGADQDYLKGGSGNDALYGGDGDDLLDGGTGNDTLVGGAGDDTYFVETQGDVITELAGGGNDTVITTTSSYTLKAELETLAYIGTGSFTGIGNGLANSIWSGVGNDTLLGLAGNDTLNGNAGDDWLDGGLGYDTLIGGAGNDTYVVDTNNDIITELAGEGTDTVRTALSSYTLKSEVENLTYTGTGAFKGTGTDDANVITGGIGADKLYGLGGADTLIGGAGKDSLYGGAGADTFVYTSAADTTVADYDYIADFSAAEGDIIDLSAIDANSAGGTSDDAFVYVGSAAFSGTAGELRFSGGMLQGDTDGDGIADLAIKLSGTSSLDAASLRL